MLSVIDKYKPISIFDPFAGWGERALAANLKNVNYVGVDDYMLPVDDDTDNDENESADESGSQDIQQEEDDRPEETETDADDASEEVEEIDVIDIPEYKTDEINVPARAATGTVVVRRGDTLYAIARENGMTLDEIARANNLSEPYTIRIGQVLKIKTETPIKTEVKPAPKAEKEVAKETPKPVKEATKSEPKPTKEVATKKTEPKVIKSEQPVKSEPKAPKDIRVPIKDITVARGDTLYSISRKYSVPVNDLAVMNGLSAPFSLSVGQTLHVPDLQVRMADTPKKPTTTTVKVSDKKVETKKTNIKEQPVKKADNKVVKQEPAKKAETKKSENKKQETKKTVKTEPKKTTEPKPTTKTPQKTEAPKIVARSSSKFSWPVRGSILSHYGAKTGGLYNDGINISAALNTSVLAAENGVVAYAGNEVRGMGNLVIIQHADGWMTVYAHMNSMTVRRGARVSVGQKIGTVGKTGKVTTPQLHFEIRKGTKAYNPVNYLKK